MALVFNPMKMALQRAIDRMFYGNTYEYRKLLQSFNERMGNVLELGELAGPVLRQITKAVHTSQASLLIREGECFTAQYAARLNDSEPVIPVRLRSNSLLAAWLTRENKPLSREQIDSIPDLKGLWESDISNLDGSEIEMLFPLRSKGNLIGILTLSKKHPAGSYSRDDIELITKLSREAALVIENAQLYAEAKRKANVDELTELFNHRYFHQRLDEEIARASRFGEVLSILYIDLVWIHRQRKKF